MNQSSQPRHDAFISYSRRDIVFAKALKVALEKFRTPRGLAIQQHYLQVFRDESDFTGNAYHDSIERHLKDSEALIVICSPDAARSQYVDDEIRRFVRDDPNRRNKTIPLLYRGLPNNKAGTEQAEDQAFPRALCELLGMPLGVDFRGFDTRQHKFNKGTYSSSWYALLANICGVSRAEIEERDRRRQRRIRWILGAITGAVFAALSIALIVTLVSREQAVKERGIADQQRQIAERRTHEAEASALAERIARTEEQHQRDLAEEQKEVAEKQRDRATLEQHRSESGQLSANSQKVTSSDPQLSLLLSFEAAMTSISAEGTVPAQAQDALHHALFVQREKLIFSVPFEIITAVAFSPDRRILASATGSQGIRLWNTVTGTPLQVDFRLPGGVIGLAFSPDGSSLATAGKDGATRIWDVKSQREKLVLHQPGQVWTVVFSPDGSRVATAGVDKVARIWDAKSGQLVMALTGHTGMICGLAFSHNGKFVATGSADQTTRIWDLATGKQRESFTEDGTVMGVSFSPLDDKLATVNSASTAVRVWDLPSGREWRKLDGHYASVFAVAYSPDGIDCFRQASIKLQDYGTLILEKSCLPTLVERTRLPRLHSATMENTSQPGRLTARSGFGVRTSLQNTRRLAVTLATSMLFPSTQTAQESPRRVTTRPPGYGMPIQGGSCSFLTMAVQLRR